MFVGCKIKQNHRFSPWKIYFKPYFSVVILFSSSPLSNKPIKIPFFITLPYYLHCGDKHKIKSILLECAVLEGADNSFHRGKGHSSLTADNGLRYEWAAVWSWRAFSATVACNYLICIILHPIRASLLLSALSGASSRGGRCSKCFLSCIPNNAVDASTVPFSLQLSILFHIAAYLDRWEPKSTYRVLLYEGFQVLGIYFLDLKHNCLIRKRGGYGSSLRSQTLNNKKTMINVGPPGEEVLFLRVRKAFLS